MGKCIRCFENASLQTFVINFSLRVYILVCSLNGSVSDEELRSLSEGYLAELDFGRATSKELAHRLETR